MMMCSGGLGARQQRLDGRHEVVGDGAADAAIGEFDDVLLGAALDAAVLKDVAVDPDIAELVDDERRAGGRWRSRADGG